MADVNIHKVILSDFSFFWRGVCTGCDWSEESLCNPDVHMRSKFHLRTTHHGGVINQANQKMEVQG